MKRILKYLLFIITASIILTCAYIGYCYLAKKPVPFFGRKITGAYFSIGSNTSKTPLSWNISETTVFDREKNNIPTEKLMADPFLHFHNEKWYAFFEIMQGKHADIGVAVEEDGNWNYLGTALDERLHLSYPFIFKRDSTIYMLPETKRFNQIRLYKATDFPMTWELDTVLLDDVRFVDPTLFQHENTWYLFVTDEFQLRLYISDAIKGEWKEHPMSPVKTGNYTRSAGRVLQDNGRLIRFGQDHFGGYGRGVYGFQIDSLSKTFYKESSLKENPILKNQGTTWAKNGMHHIDIHKLNDGTYKAIYDGYGFGKEKITFSLKNNF